MLILGGSGIVTNNIANTGGQYFDYGLLPLHSPWIMHDPRPSIDDAPLILILGGRRIITKNVANNSSQYFDYGLLPLHSPSIMQDARTEIVDAPLTLICSMGYSACHFPLYLSRRPILSLWKDVSM